MFIQNIGKSIIYSKEFLATIVFFLFAQDCIQIANTKTLPMFTLGLLSEQIQ
jgi:hypothetical protein